ncbi:MAG: SRPBCC domain-containing protein [Microbacteriaceae bacterium]|nr:SRPBCC domain-containing protein [Microbacteriaceae bacterium]
MPVIDTSQDDTSFTVVTEFDAPVERVWELWADARQLERWWGPPGYPATFTRHDFTVPGRSVYWMPGDGDVHPNYAAWSFVDIQPPNALEVDNGFADETGEPVPGFPWNRFSVRLEADGPRTRMTVRVAFGSAAELERMLGYGMREGFLAALSQTDAILAEG